MAVTTLDRDEVRQATTRLPERQRAALELREGRGLSYEQIAATLGTSAGAVAQLLERARINLYDELRGTALASVAAPSAECERALPLIAARQDGELGSPAEDAAWLDSHLSGCDRCRLAAKQMGEAAAIYRGEASPAAASAPTAATSAFTTGAERVAAAGGRLTATGTASAAVSPDPLEGPHSRRSSRRRMAVGCSLLALALGGIVVALLADNGSPGVPSAADAAAGGNAAAAISAARVVRPAQTRTAAEHAGKPARSGAGAAGFATSQAGGDGSVATPLYTPTRESNGGSGGAPTHSSHSSDGDAAVQPARPGSTAKPAANPEPPSSSAQAPQPTAKPASEPAPAPPPAEEPTPPAEEPTAEHGHKGEPPGKPANRPPDK